MGIIIKTKVACRRVGQLRQFVNSHEIWRYDYPLITDSSWYFAAMCFGQAGKVFVNSQDNFYWAELLQHNGSRV